MADLDVRVLITAAADQLRQELAGAGNSVASFGQRASASLNATGDRLVGLGRKVSLGVTGPLAAAGGAAVAMAKRFAAAGDEIAKTAAKVGVGGEALQELRFAAEQSGVEAGTLDMALQRFSRRVGEAAQGGGELKDTLEQYGIAVTDAEGKTRSVEAVFADLADAVASTDSQSEQLRISFKAFDSEGAALVNLLRGGSDEVAALREQFRELGLGISGETLAVSERFAGQWNIVTQQLQAAGTAIADQLLPVLVNDLMPIMIDTVIPGLVKAGQAVGDLITWFADLPAPVQQAAGIVAAAIGAGGPILLALGIMAKAFAAIIAVGTGPIGLFIGAAALAAAAWVKWGDDIKLIVGGAIESVQLTFTAFNEWWNEFWAQFFELFRETFGAGFAFITETTTAVTQGVINAWQFVSDTLVGESIIPDMWLRIQEHFAAGSNALARSSAATAKVTSRNFSAMSKSSIGSMQELFTAFSEHSKAMFVASRIAGIAQALIATYQGIAEALKLGWPLGPIAAAKIAAIGFAQVASIKATALGTGGGGGRGGGASGISGGSAGAIAGAVAQPVPAAEPARRAAEPERQQVIQVNIESRRNLFTREDIEVIIEQINEALGDNAVLGVR